MTQTTTTLAQVGERGELLIPADILDALRLEDNRQVRLELRDGELVVRPAREKRSFAALEGLFRRGKGMSKEEMDDFIRTMRGDL